jgi:hypothetical protein
MHTTIPLVPEFGVVDLLDPRLTVTERGQLFEDYAAIHRYYFPSYPHVMEDLEHYAVTGQRPTGEIVHAWLVFREQRPVGVWNFHVNRDSGVLMMLFGAIHREARQDLPREYLPRLVDFLIEQCIAEAHDHGFALQVAILESDEGHVARWTSCGFHVVDHEYREPRHGIHWAKSGEPTFFDDYSACVMPIDAGIGRPIGELGELAVRTLLIDHYRLPAGHPSVVESLARAGLAVH